MKKPRKNKRAEKISEPYYRDCAGETPIFTENIADFARVERKAHCADCKKPHGEKERADYLIVKRQKYRSADRYAHTGERGA